MLRALLFPTMGAAMLAMPAAATTILPSPTTLAHCVIDSTTLDNPTSCTLGSGTNVFASLTLFPLVSLTAQAASAPNDAAGASATVRYSFEVIGGNPGDIVPILIATTLSTVGTDLSHGIGFAELAVRTSAAGDSVVAVCTDGTCGTTATSFSGTLSTRAR